MKIDLYVSTSELPLYNFIKIVETGNLKWLLLPYKVSKTVQLPTDKELNEVWSKIHAEYLAETADKQFTHVFGLLKENAVYELKLAVVTGLISALRFGYHEGAALELKNQGYTVKNLSDEDDYQNQLSLVLTRLKTLNFYISKNSKEIEKYYEGNEQENNGFEPVLTELSRFQGYKLDTKETTVKEFTSILKRYKQEHETKAS